MKKILILWGVFLLCGFLIFLTAPAFALPTLQLDIVGDHYYDYTTETIVATDSTFAVRALLLPDSINTINDTYYLSMAILPRITIEDDTLDLGSFTFDSQTIGLVEDMTYGSPPEWLAENKDLQDHGVFETYYYLESFQFDPYQQVEGYNTQTDVTVDNMLFNRDFSIDVTGLDPLYVLHFDLFNISTNSKGVQYVKDFAPFSHDAESSPVPEPATMLLFGTGLIGLAGLGRKKFIKNN